MSEVKRYTESCMEGGGVVESKDGELVDYSAYAAAQSELSAPREELANAKEWANRLDKRCVTLATDKDKLIDVCKSAEQKNSVLVELLRDAACAVKVHAMTEWAVPLYIRISEELNKPTESGASE